MANEVRILMFEMITRILNANFHKRYMYTWLLCSPCIELTSWSHSFLRISLSVPGKVEGTLILMIY